MAKENHNGRRIALGALIAGAAGYITGILTAPKSGKETREEISDTAVGVKDDTVQQLQNLQNDLDNLIKDAKDRTLNLGAKAREDFNEAVIRAKDAKNKSGMVLKGLRAGQADDPDLNRAIKQAKQAKKNLGKFFKN